MFFIILILFVITQRLVELRIAKQNEKWIVKQGGYEVGASHYPYMVLLHSTFFIFLAVEVFTLERNLSSAWIVFLSIFLLAQFGRLWCLLSLGKFWNTKIMILPNAKVIKKGPYKLFRHPNYLIVTIELLTLPLIFNAFFTTVIYMALNIWMLSIRIPVEEKALREATNYHQLYN